ncbi:MAG: hypothetical protein NT096_07645 [Proteobacteria bacterium]|nr:hypothetical protein [Pseudomonadota bacterium]
MPSRVSKNPYKRFGRGWLFNIKYSPDGKHLAVSTSIGIELFDTKEYKLVGFLTGHDDYIVSDSLFS